MRTERELGTEMRTTALTDDGWAILALPRDDDGGRDLSCVQTWERSLKRSQLRRARAATERRNLPASRKVGVAIAASAILAPLAQQTASAQETATASTSTTTATASASSGLLRQGSSGPEVSRIQSALGISADGSFGPATKAAVIAYQSKMGLLVDGIVGPQTRGALFGGGTSQGTSGTSGTSTSAPPSRPSRPATA